MRKRPEVITSTALIAIAAALFFAGLAAVVALAAGTPLGWMSAPVQASHNGGVVALYALDMDPNNTPANSIDAPTDADADTTPDTESTTQGTIQNCIAVTHPATFPVDVVVQGWPATDPLVGYTTAVTFPAGLSVSRDGGANLGSVTGDVAVLGRTLVSADPQSGPSYFAVNDLPNYGSGADLAGPNTWDANVIDFSPFDADENVDGEEISDGFLARIWLKTTAAGPALLNVDLGGSGPQDDGGFITVTTVQGGVVAVDTACATPPDAVDDAGPVATVAEDSGANSIDVLANDTDGGSPPITITAVSDPPDGTAAINGTAIDYTPDANFFGSDSFTYTIQNAVLGTDTATVNVTVTSVNDAPVATDVSMGDIAKNSFANGWQPLVSDVDTGDTLTCSIVDQPTNGSATVQPDCSSGTYDPAAGYTGPDSFTYSVSDGTDSDTATATLDVVAQLPTPTAVASPTATATASPTASPTATATSLPGTGSPNESGDGGGGLTYLAIGLASLAVAGGALTVAAMLRRKAIRNRHAG